MFFFVVTCASLMPTGLLIMRVMWMQPGALPVRDDLLILVIHASAAVLLAKMRATGWGSILGRLTTVTK